MLTFVPASGILRRLSNMLPAHRQCNASWLQALCGAAPAQANQTSCHERTWFCGWDDSQHTCGPGFDHPSAMCSAVVGAGVGTFGAWNHLVLPNAQLSAGDDVPRNLAVLFARSNPHDRCWGFVVTFFQECQQSSCGQASASL